jgi:hypothetical protein
LAGRYGPSNIVPILWAWCPADCTIIMIFSVLSVTTPYGRPTAALMAHMKRMVIWDMLVGLRTRLRPSARAPDLDYAPREPSRRYASMAQKEPIGASLRAHGTGIRMFEHPRAHPTLHGGMTLAPSPSCGSQPTPWLNNRYSELLFAPSGARSEQYTPEGLHLCMRSMHRCLSIPEHT